MADFTADLAAPQGAGASPLAPIEPVVGNAPNPWANVVAAGINLFAGMKEKEEAADKKKAQEAIVTDFVRANTTINDAVSSGQMTRSEAAIRQRAVFNQYSANHPTFVNEFGKLRKDLTEGTELGESLEEEQAIQVRERKIEQDMVDAGLPLYPGMNPKTKEEFKGFFLEQRREEKKLEAIEKRAEAARKAGDYDRRVFEFESKQAIASNLNGMGKNIIGPTMSFVSDLSKEASSPEQKKVSMQKLTNHFALIDANIAQISSVEPGLAANWKGVFDELRKNATDLVMGDLDAKAYKTAEESLKSRIQVMALQTSPRMQALYAQNSLLGNVFSTAVDVNQEAQSLLVHFSQVGGVDGNLPRLVGSQEERTTLSVVESAITNLANGNQYNTEVSKRQTGVFLDNYLTQLSADISTGKGGKEVAVAMDFIAGPSFKKAMEMGIVSRDKAMIAAQTNASYFEQKVAPLVNEKLSKPFEGKQSYSDLVEIQWGGAGPIVVPLDRRLTPEQAATREKIILDLKPSMDALGKVTRAGAHLENHTDYAKFFEENKASWLPSMYAEDGSRVMGKGREVSGKILDASGIPLGTKMTPDQLIPNKTVLGGMLYIGRPGGIDGHLESAWAPDPKAKKRR